MQITIKPYFRSVIIDGEEVREIVTPFPDFLNHLAAVSCEASDTSPHTITRVEGVHRYVTHFIAREYYYEHLDAFISWFYTEKQAQIDKAVADQTNLEQTVKSITDPKFAVVEDEIHQHEVTNLFYNAGLKTVNLVKGNVSTLTATLPEATDNTSGLMTSGDVSSLRDLEAKVNSLINQGIWRATYHTYAEMLTDNPNMIVSDASWNLGDFVYVQADEQYDPADKPLTSYVVTSTGSNFYQLVFRKVEPVNSGVATATNTALGVVKGTESTKGKVYVETDGSMSVVGWDKVQTNHAPAIMTIEEIEEFNDGGDKYPDLVGKRVLVTDEDIETIAPSVPLFGVVHVPFKTVIPGFLSLTKDNGVLLGNILPEAYQELVNLKANGESNILTFAQYDAAIAANGVCGSFALDENTKSFKVPYIPNLYIRGLDTSTSVGKYQTDQMRPITGSWEQSEMPVKEQASTTGALSRSSTARIPSNVNRNNNFAGGALVLNSALLGIHYSGLDTHPMSVVFDVQIKIFGRITNIATLNVDEILSTISSIKASNQSGQVKVNYLNLKITGTTANTISYPRFRLSTYTISPKPVTKWPTKSVEEGINIYETGMYVMGLNESADRLRENPIEGQVHRWRIIGSFTNKSSTNGGAMIFSLVNPDSTFSVTDTITLPTGVTTGLFSAELTTIADSASLAIGKGYKLGVTISFTDNNMAITIDSITRVSEAIDPF